MRFRYAQHLEHDNAVQHFRERVAFGRSEIEIGAKYGKSYRVVLTYYTARPGVGDALAHSVVYPCELYTRHAAFAVLTSGSPALGFLGVCCGRVAESGARTRSAANSNVPYDWETLNVEDMLVSVPERAWDVDGEHRNLLGLKLEGTPLGVLLREAVAVRLLALRRDVHAGAVAMAVLARDTAHIRVPEMGAAGASRGGVLVGSGKAPA